MNKVLSSVDGFERPPPSLIIWRYMSLEKFLHLITRNQLRFTLASKLTDEHELRLPLEKIEADYYSQWCKEREEDASVEDERQQWDQLDKLRQRVDSLRERTFLSCWSSKQYESYALWKIYLGGSRAGVAIKSTVSALEKAIQPGGRKVFMARVRYSDSFENDALQDSDFILHKSRYYEYENELRLFLDEPTNHEIDINDPLRMSPMTPSAIGLNVDTSTLIREIYLSPFVIGGFRKTLEEIVQKVNPAIEAKIHNSAVRDS
jgi:hypothetical protein